MNNSKPKTPKCPYYGRKYAKITGSFVNYRCKKQMKARSLFAEGDKSAG